MVSILDELAEMLQHYRAGGSLASQGRFGDTMLAHINPQEAQLLEAHGGAGTINPKTGLPEFHSQRFKAAQALSAYNAAMAAGDNTAAQSAYDTYQYHAGKKDGGFFGHGFTGIRDTLESAASLAGNYFLPGSSLVTDHLVSKGSQRQLGSTIGQIAQAGTGLAGSGVGSSFTGIPSASSIGAGWTNAANAFGNVIDAGDVGTNVSNGFSNLLGGGSTSTLPWLSGSGTGASSDIASSLGRTASVLGAAGSLASGLSSHPNSSNLGDSPYASQAAAAQPPISMTSKGGPGMINGMSSLTPMQQATGLATQGTYGGGLGHDEQGYYANLLNRQLTSGGSLNPIEQSYNSQLGFGNQPDTTSLLGALHKWQPNYA